MLASHGHEKLVELEPEVRGHCQWLDINTRKFDDVIVDETEELEERSEKLQTYKVRIEIDLLLADWSILVVGKRSEKAIREVTWYVSADCGVRRIWPKVFPDRKNFLHQRYQVLFS